MATETIRPTDHGSLEAWTNDTTAYDGNSSTYAAKSDPNQAASLSMGMTGTNIDDAAQTDAWETKTNDWTAATLNVTFERTPAGSNDTQEVSYGWFNHTTDTYTHIGYLFGPTTDGQTKTTLQATLSTTHFGTNFANISLLRVLAGGDKTAGPDSSEGRVYDTWVDGTYTTATTHESSLTYALQVNQTHAQPILQAEANESFDIDVAATPTNIATLLANQSFEVQPGLTPTKTALLEAILSTLASNLGQTQTATVDVAAIIEAALTYALQQSLAQADDVIFEANESFDLSKTLTLAQPILLAEASISFTQNNSFSVVGELVADVSFTLGASLSSIINTDAIYWVVYPSAQGDPIASEIINGTVSNGIFSHDTAPNVTTVDFTGSQINGLTTDASYKLAAVYSDGDFTSNVVITTAWIASGAETFEVAITYNLQTNQLQVAATVLEASETFALQTSQSQTSDANYNASLDLDNTLNILLASEVSLEVATTFVNNLAYSNIAIADLNATLIAANQLDISQQRSIITESTMSLASSLNLINSSNAIFERDFNLNLVQDISKVADVLYESSVSFDSQHAATSVAALIYNAALTYHKTLDLSLDSDAVLETSILFTSSLTDEEIGNKIFFADLSFDSTKSISFDSDISLEVALTLAHSLASTFDNQAQYQVALSFLNTLSESYTETTVFNSAITFANSLLDSYYNGIVSDRSLSLNNIVDLALSSDISLETATAFGTLFDIDLDNTLDMNSLLELSQSLSEANNVLATFSSNLDLNNSLDFQNNNITALQAALTLSKTITYLATAGQTLNENLDLSNNLQAINTAFAIYNAATALASEQTFSATASRTLTADQFFNLAASVNLSNVINLNASVTIGTTNQLDLVGFVDALGVLEAALDIGIVQGQEQLSIANLFAASTFDSALTLTLNSTSVLESAVSYALQTDTVYELGFILEGNIDLSLSQIYANSVNAEYYSNIDLPYQIALQAISEAILNADLPLSVIKSLEVSGSLFVTTLVLPCGRTLKVQIENRILTVAAENRITTVNAEDRQLSVSEEIRTLNIETNCD